MASPASTILDALVILLLAVFFYLAVRRLLLAPVTPREKREPEDSLREMSLDEDRVTELIDLRSQLKENETAIRQQYLNGRMDEKAYREILRTNLLQQKEVDREFKRMGVL